MGLNEGLANISREPRWLSRASSAFEAEERMNEAGRVPIEAGIEKLCRF